MALPKPGATEECRIGNPLALSQRGSNISVYFVGNNLWTCLPNSFGLPHCSLRTSQLSLQSHSPPSTSHSTVQHLQACCYSAHLSVNKQQLKHLCPVLFYWGGVEFRPLSR